MNESEITLVICMKKGAEPCAYASECRVLPMWEEFYGYVKSFFENRTIADLMRRDVDNEYVI